MNRSKCSNSYTNKSSESNWGVHRYANNFDLFEYGEASMDGLTVLLLYIQFFFYNLLFKISTNRNLQVWNWSIIGVPFPLHETCIEISFGFVYFFSLSLFLSALYSKLKLHIRIVMQIKWNHGWCSFLIIFCFTVCCSKLTEQLVQIQKMY